MGRVVAIIIIVALAGFVIYELVSLTMSIVNKFKKKKHKNDDINDEHEKGAQ